MHGHAWEGKQAKRGQDTGWAEIVAKNPRNQECIYPELAAASSSSLARAEND
jgi:hypothetical protein